MQNRHFFHFLIILLFTTFINHKSSSQTPDLKLWTPNWPVNAIVADSHNAYISGAFDHVGPYTGFGAKLTDTNDLFDKDFPTISGLPFYYRGWINCVISDGSGGWYIGGVFSKVGGYSRNNLAHIKSDMTVDTLWDPNMMGVDILVDVLAMSGSDIYVGGHFTHIGGQSRNNIAKLNNTNGKADSSWNPNANGRIYEITISGSDIFVGGGFSNIGGQPRSCLAKLNNTNGNANLFWRPDPDQWIYSIAINGNDIYVGGSFYTIGGQARNRIAKLNNTNGNADGSWNPNPSITGHYPHVSVLAVSGNDIYAGGYFTHIGGQARNHLAKLNNTNGNADSFWNPNVISKYPNQNPAVNTLVVSGNDIYAGGNFTRIGGQSRNYIARLNMTNGNADSSWNPNANWTVSAIAISGNDIYAGGWFSSIGGQSRNFLAKMNNSSGTVDSAWNPDANPWASTLCMHGEYIYAVGSFTTPGGQPRNVVKLNKTTGEADTSWNPNSNGQIRTIVSNGNDIYVGGWFTTIDGQSRNRIARLNTTNGNADSSWNPNANGPVFSFAFSGNDMYVGGDFSSVGGLVRNGIAKLNISTGNIDSLWNPNANEYVGSLACSGNDIYATGYFTTIGGQSRKYVAKLNNTNGNADSNWNADANNKVIVISSNGNDIYVGGNFTSIGRESRNCLAKLNNTNGNADANWNPIGVGCVYSIAFSDSDIYAGGGYDSFAGNEIRYLAKLKIPIVTAPVITSQPSSHNKCLGDTSQFTLSASGISLTYCWYHNSIAIANSNYHRLVINNVTTADTGNYYCIIYNSEGSDTSKLVKLFINQLYAINTSHAICNGDSLVFNGKTYKTNGTYYDTLQSIHGCDSIIMTQLSVLPVYALNNPREICEGGSYNFNGKTYTIKGTYYDTLPSIKGCDSIVITQLIVNPVFSLNNPQEICDGDSYTINGNSYTIKGTYDDTLQSIKGCDSIVRTQLKVNPMFAINNPQEICNGSLYKINGHTYIANGTYQDTMQSFFGCDSIVSTILSVVTIDTSVTINGKILTANASGLSYQWLDCNNGNMVITNETNQSFTPVKSGNYSVEFTKDQCIDTSNCYQITVVGFDEYTQSEEIIIYPNPARQIITFTFGQISVSQLEITNLVGQLVYSREITNPARSSLELDISGFQKGIYFIKCQTNNGTIVKRFIKE